jgi:hypothetical protein
MTPRNKAINIHKNFLIYIHNTTIFESFLISIILVDGVLETGFIVFFYSWKKSKF